MGRKPLSDFDPGRTGVSVAELSDGESMECLVIEDAFLAETEYSSDAIHLPVKVLEVPPDMVDMSGDDVRTEGETEDANEYNIINSSTGFYNALVDAIGESGHDGELIRITAHQEGYEDTSRYYDIEKVED